MLAVKTKPSAWATILRLCGAGVLALRQRLQQLTLADVRALAAGRPGLMDFLGLLAQDGAVLDWVQFRAHILAERMGEFRAAVQAAGGRDKVFGSDVFPASTGLLGGHWYGKWEEATDFLTGGSSHGGVVGWATGVTNLARGVDGRFVSARSRAGRKGSIGSGVAHVRECRIWICRRLRRGWWKGLCRSPLCTSGKWLA